MGYEDGRDNMLRRIRGRVRLLSSIMMGKQISTQDLAMDEKYSASGKTLAQYQVMIDHGDVNDAENDLWEELDYTDKTQVFAAVIVYQYMSEKGDEFLEQHDFSQEEVYDGLKRLAQSAGYGEVCDIVEM